MYEWQPIIITPIPIRGTFQLQFMSSGGHVYFGELSKEWGPTFAEVWVDGSDIIAIAPLTYFTDWRFHPNEKGETDDR